MYAFEDHHAHRDGPEDVDGYVTLRKIYWLIAHNIFRLKVNFCLLYTSPSPRDCS